MVENALHSPLAEPSTTANRRAAVRWRYEGRAQCRTLGTKLDEWVSGAARDISIQAIALLLGTRPPRGAILEVQLQSAEGGFLPARLARVRRAVAQGTGQWLVGCTFARKLSEAELQSLL